MGLHFQRLSWAWLRVSRAWATRDCSRPARGAAGEACPDERGILHRVAEEECTLLLSLSPAGGFYIVRFVCCNAAATASGGSWCRFRHVPSPATAAAAAPRFSFAGSSCPATSVSVLFLAADITLCVARRCGRTAGAATAVFSADHTTKRATQQTEKNGRALCSSVRNYRRRHDRRHGSPNISAYAGAALDRGPVRFGSNSKLCAIYYLPACCPMKNVKFAAVQFSSTNTRNGNNVRSLEEHFAPLDVLKNP